jgi:DNA-binding transcriptional MocR family regulator
MAAINDLLVPLGVTVEVNTPKHSTAVTAGGFFTYLRLPDDLPAARVVAAFALENLLRIAFGHMFVVTGDDGSVVRAESVDGFAKCIRLCWAWHEEAEIKEGIERLASTILDIRERIKKGEEVGSEVSIGIR